jgi:hypothetical protein
LPHRDRLSQVYNCHSAVGRAAEQSLQGTGLAARAPHHTAKPGNRPRLELHALA